MKLMSFLLVLTMTAITSAQSVQLMTPQEVAVIRAALPRLEDDERDQQLHSADVVWYDQRVMPPTHQMRNATGTGRTYFLNSFYNISGDPTDRGRPLHGSWVNEFPWTQGKPGGAHRSTTVSSIKGFDLTGPAIVFERNVRGDPDLRSRDIITDWVFKDGSRFWEVIMQRLKIDGELQDVVFEVRVREKAGDGWEVDIFRPFATADQLADALEELDGGDHRTQAISYLRGDDAKTTTERLVDALHDVKFAFDVTTDVLHLPVIDGQHVVGLLERPFVSCLGETFYKEATGPVNRTGFAHIVPNDYDAAHIAATGTSNDCMSCHESSGLHGMEHQRTVVFNGRRVRRGAYGHIQGSWSDKILSWHPISVGSISPSGGYRQVALRRSFVQNGWARRLQGNQLPQGYNFTKVD